jgi:hypothetical protein
MLVFFIGKSSMVYAIQQQKRNIWPVWQLTNTIVLAYVRTIQYFLISNSSCIIINIRTLGILLQRNAIKKINNNIYLYKACNLQLSFNFLCDINRNDPDLIQAFLKKRWVESDFKAPNLPLVELIPLVL